MPKWIILLTVLLIFGCGKVEDESGVVTKIEDGLNFAEGPAWSSAGVLYISNCYGDWVAQVQDDQLDTFVVKPTAPDTFSNTNGLTMAKDGYLYACDFGRGAIVRFNSKGQCSVYAGEYEGVKFNRPNDLAFDPAGNLYFTDPNQYDRDQRDGRIFRVDRETGQVLLISDNLAFPNGIAFSADAKILFVCESAMSRILQYDVTTEGLLENQKEFVALPGGDPDGIALDEQGNLYAAHYGTGTVFVINPAGEIFYEIKIPDGKKTTNVEFGGPDLMTLYITDAHSNAVYKMRNSIPGLKLHYWD